MIIKIFAVLALTFSTSALAYLDPGTGSMILQGLIAGIAISWFAIKTYWYKLGSIFGKNKPSSLGEEEEEEESRISNSDQNK